MSAETTHAPYRVLTAATLEQLEAQVCAAIAAGYVPCGGPFNASTFLPPHGGVAQAVQLPKK